VTQWQTSIPDQPPKSGWGGRIADLMHPLQYDLHDGIPRATARRFRSAPRSPGANTFEVGNTFQQYHVSTNGAVTMSGVSGNRLKAVKDILALSDTNCSAPPTRTWWSVRLQRGTAEPRHRAHQRFDLFQRAVCQQQPRQSAQDGGKLIAARDALSMKRQIFFCSVGGYDTHTSQTGATNNMPTQLSDRTRTCSRVERRNLRLPARDGADRRSGQGDLLHASDFGRTFPTNGQGSDHGWGNHQMIIGGAVRGQRTYGTFPTLAVNGRTIRAPAAGFRRSRWISTLRRSRSGSVCRTER
jgi:hypothetical protein